MARTESTPADPRDVLKEQIQATLKFLPVSRDQVDEAYLENNKQILVEDFGVADDAELLALIMNYRPSR